MKVIECPRDAMQGIRTFIPTEKKIKYLNRLLKVGFDTLDFGSFVSPKAVPQMADTVEVLAGLETEKNTKLLAIIANTRGAEEASKYKAINFLGFPLSLSETFQQRNTNKSIKEAFETIKTASEIAISTGKTLVVYLSMGFGNPYGDPFSPALTVQFTEKLAKTGIRIISLADTVGVADPKTIKMLFEALIPTYPEIEFGAHFHSNPMNITQKLEAAFSAGCQRFDAAIKGFGGCPMAKDELIGNMPTEKVLSFLQEKKRTANINFAEFNKAYALANEIFP